MTKTKILVLILTLVMSATLLPTAMAKVQKPTLTFSAAATGECLVAPTMGPTNEPYLIGKGMIGICGSAYATANDPAPGIPVTFYLTDAGVKAIGIVSVQWENQRIDVALYSSKAQGLFVDEGDFSDIFSVGGFPGGELDMASMLMYQGRIKDSAGSRTISGKAIAITQQLGPTRASTALIVWLLKSDGSSLKAIVWSPIDVVIPNVPIPIPAANAFMRSVKINN